MGIEKTGVAALGVHGRTKDQRPGDRNNVEMIRKIVENTSIPVIANGGSSNNRESAENTYEGLKRFWEQSGAASVMVARAAEWNTSVFREEGKEDVMTVIDKYLVYAIKYDYPFTMVKYCVQQMLGGLQDSDLGRKFLDSSTNLDICRVFNVENKYLERQKEIESFGWRPDDQFNNRMKKEPGGETKKRKHGDIDVMEMFLPFVRGHYGSEDSRDLPKTRLWMWAKEQKLDQPRYKVMQQDKKFKSIVEVQQQFFSSESWEKNKRYAEQAAALVAISCLEIPEVDKNKIA